MRDNTSETELRKTAVESLEDFLKDSTFECPIDVVKLV